MSYRNGTYVAFDGQGTTNPMDSDLKYYALLSAWNENKKIDFCFSDSHKKTYQVLDSSSLKTLKNRLMERMSNSKNMLLILSTDTNYDRGLLNFEIEKAVDFYEIPIIVAYTGCAYLLKPHLYSNRWPRALRERIEDGSLKAIHIPFKEKPIIDAIGRFSVNSTERHDMLEDPLCRYTREAYEQWNLL